MPRSCDLWCKEDPNRVLKNMILRQLFGRTVVM